MICRMCKSDMTLDPLVAADAVRAIDPGLPVPVVLRCRHGHSERVSPIDLSPSPVEAASRTPLRCAVCGAEIPRRKGGAPRKSCSPEHTRFIEVKRAEALKIHRAIGTGPFFFVVEAQPWYRGPATAFRAAARRLPLRTGPVFPEIPAVWLEGFRAVYPFLEEPAPAFPSTFPAIEDMHDDPALVFKTRRYRRRRPRPGLTPAQLMPYPVRDA